MAFPAHRDQPHDRLFREVFGQRRHAAALFLALLPPALAAAIDWRTLALCRDRWVKDLKEQVSDGVFFVRLKCSGLRLYLLLEHKSGRAPWLSLQLLGYELAIQHAHRRERGGARSRPLVLRVVVSHGFRPSPRSRGWPDLPQLAGVDPAVRREIQALLVQVPVVRCDLLALAERRLRELPLTPLGRLTFLVLRGQRWPADKLVRRMRRWRALVRAVLADPASVDGHDDLGRIVWYLQETGDMSRAALNRLLDDIAGTTTNNAMITTADRMRVEFLVEMLLEQLTARFGPLPDAIVARMQKANSKSLRRWAIAVLTARTLPEVFRAPRKRRQRGRPPLAAPTRGGGRS